MDLVLNNWGEFGIVELAKDSVEKTQPSRFVSPLGRLIQRAMKLLDLSYQDITSRSSRLAHVYENPDMRIGKSTLGNIISGLIRQPSIAKLDSLRIILHLSRDEIDLATGLAPERRLSEQLQTKSERTYELSNDLVARHQTIRLPLLREDANLKQTQFLNGIVDRWAQVEVEYLTSFFPPHLKYLVIGEFDTRAAPVAPPGTRVLVNTLINKIRPSGKISFHERELYCALIPDGLTCSYLEQSLTGKVVVVPHPLSGRMREEFNPADVMIVGQVVGLLFR
jgi:transcriptional regulator with XRE-family HTH domain